MRPKASLPLHLHQIIHSALVIAGLLRVWIHVAGLPHFGDSDCLRHDCGDILSAECGELPLAMDVLPLGRLHIHVILDHPSFPAVVCAL